MLIQSGVDRQGEPLGLPFGSYARFRLLFLQSEAIRTASREVVCSTVTCGFGLARWASP